MTANGRPGVASSKDSSAAASTSGRPDGHELERQAAPADDRRPLAERRVGDRAPHAARQLGEHVHPIDRHLDREVRQQLGDRVEAIGRQLVGHGDVGDELVVRRALERALRGTTVRSRSSASSTCGSPPTCEVGDRVHRRERGHRAEPQRERRDGRRPPCARW